MSFDLLDLPVVVTGTAGVRWRPTSSGFAIYGGRLAVESEQGSILLRDAAAWSEGTTTWRSVERMLDGAARYRVEHVGSALRITHLGTFAVNVVGPGTHSRLTCTTCGWSSRISRLRRNARFMIGEQLQHRCPNTTIVFEGGTTNG